MPVAETSKEAPGGGSAPSSLTTTQAPYTVFTKRQKWYLTCLLGYLTLASSLTATIYFPLIDLLAGHYNTSIQGINLTITLYVVLQGVTPAFWSPLSDTLGRRPIFLATFAVYTAASLGLTFAGRNYTALLLLRAFQSVGGSAVLSLAYAVVADITVHAERGSILAPMLAATNLGPCIGPVIGGAVIQASGDPIWCFRALLIFGGSAVLLIGWTMPETCRLVVGNGAVPPRGLWKIWWSTATGTGAKAPDAGAGGADAESGRQCPRIPRRDTSTASGTADVNSGKVGKGKLVFPNPLSSLRLLFYRDTSLILWLAGSPYSLWYCVQTSIPLIFGLEYGFRDVYVGLSFLAGGAGVISGGFIAGRLMDWSYRKTARESGLVVNRAGGDDIHRFPIERARSRGSIRILAISTCVVVAYGWVVEKQVHPAVPLLMQFYIGCKATVLLQVYSALLVDIFPDSPGTAAASNNIVRCGLSAAAVAALQPLNDSIGRAWVFTLLALIDGVGCVLAVLVLRRWGKGWRDERNQADQHPAGNGRP